MDAAVAISDSQAANAVERLAVFGVSAGPCGAATLAATQLAAMADHRSGLGLDEDISVILLNTERFRTRTETTP